MLYQYFIRTDVMTGTGRLVVQTILEKLTDSRLPSHFRLALQLTCCF